MLTNKSVLIVDDEAGVRQALIRGIRQKFNKTNIIVSITEASNGQEAIELANDSQPDLILMDIRMPVMNGLKACRILRNDSKFAATKIIILTCAITEESEGLLSGADDYVIKPFDINTLLIRIERGLSQPRLPSNGNIIDFHGVISKDCFYQSCLHFEIARAKRFQHPLSLLLLRISSSSSAGFEKNIKAQLIKVLMRRSSDKLIAWGAKTFAILLTETNANDATLVAKHLIMHLENRDELLRTFIGIANLEDTLCDDLVGNAESSLKQAVRTGNIILNRLAIH